MIVDLDMIEEITARADAMKIGLAAYPVDEIRGLLDEVRRWRAREVVRSGLRIVQREARDPRP